MATVVLADLPKNNAAETVYAIGYIQRLPAAVLNAARFYAAIQGLAGALLPACGL